MCTHGFCVGLHSHANPYMAARSGTWGMHTCMWSMHMYVQCACRAAAFYLGLSTLSWPWSPGRRHVYREPKVQHGGSQDLASLIKRKQKGLRGKGVCLFLLNAPQVIKDGCVEWVRRDDQHFPIPVVGIWSVLHRLMFWTLSPQLVI